MTVFTDPNEEDRKTKRIRHRYHQNYYRVEYINMKKILSSYGMCYLLFLSGGPACFTELRGLFNDRNCAAKMRMLSNVGLVSSYVDGSRKYYRLTEMGSRIADNIHEINELVKSLETDWKKIEMERTEPD